MDIRQLHYFLVLCDEMNYSRAAQRLFLSRQALRQSISALEAELCGPLFLSAHHKLTLTDRGMSLQRHAAPVVEQFQQMQAFSKFINDESLNAKQIAFVQKVIHYIEQNGYVESKAVLMKPPFDQPILFTRLFDGKMGGELMETIDAVRENAVHVTA